MSIETLLAQARQRAQRLLGRALEDTPAISDLRQALEQVAAVERELAHLGSSIKALGRVGQARPEDYRAYNTLARNLQTTQGALLVAVRRVLQPVAPEVLRDIPRKAPKVPKLYPEGYSAPQAVSGLQGLGNPAAAGGAAALSPWMVCAIVLAALAAFGALVYITGTVAGLVAENVANILVVREQAQAIQATIDGRLQVYQNCLDAGGNPSTCAGEAVEAVPTPREAQIQLPETGGWVKWAAGGAVVLAVLGVGFYVYRQRAEGAEPAALQGPSRTSYRRIAPHRFPYEPAADGGLEV